jgi:DNA repair exonuclease SbcCD ATPase subunit
MKDKNGIERKCENCRNTIFGPKCYFCKGYDKFLPTDESYEARIAELQKELNVVQESERAEAQEADRLREEVKELKAHNEVLQKRVEEFSMELLDYNMKENKDVLEG